MNSMNTYANIQKRTRKRKEKEKKKDTKNQKRQNGGKPPYPDAKTAMLKPVTLKRLVVKSN